LFLSVDVTAVKTVQQKPDSDFVADSNFNSQVNSDDKSVLEIVLNVTLSYYPPEPDGWRDWSIYLKSWIESFGNTLVDIFTSPKNPQHPETNSKFWDDLSDVSAANVPDGGLIPKEIPTPPPTYIVYPEQSAANKAIMGLGVGVGVLAFIIFICGGCYLHRKLKQDSTKRKKEKYDDAASYEFSKMSSYDSRSRRSRRTRSTRSEVRTRSTRNAAEYNRRAYKKLLEGIQEESESDSSSDSSSSESSSDSSEASSSSSSSSSSEEPVRARKSFLKITHQEPPSPASARSRATTMSKSDNKSYASENKSYASYASDNKSYASDNKSYASYGNKSDASDNKSYASYASGNSYASDNKSHASYPDNASQATNSTDVDAEEYINVVNRAATNDPTLRIIALDNKKSIGHNDDGEQLWSALVNNQFVECLSLRNSNVDDGQISALSIALMDNRSISRLWLENNVITSEGAEYLISALDSNHKITEVRLDGNSYIDPKLMDDINSILDGASALSMVSTLCSSLLELFR
jgi:hypothetical protein